MNHNKNNIPIIYSCSGCSSAAQMANYIAIQIDRKGLAEMSCIAGVGGNIKPILHKVFSGRKIIAIDGCSLTCSKACLNNHQHKPNIHIDLTALGVKKKLHQDFDVKEANDILKIIEQKIKSAQ